MLKSRTVSGFGRKRDDPNLFVAARDNDVDHLAAGCEAGKRLDEQDEFSGFTPLHVAALNGSLEFLVEALEHESANVWIRDFDNRLPIDHSDARSERDIGKLFYDRMYPGGQVPLPAVD